MKNNTGTVHGVDYWKDKIAEDPKLSNMFEELKSGELCIQGTRYWDINWLIIAIAAGELELADKMLTVHDQQWSIGSCGLSLKERIALLILDV